MSADVPQIVAIGLSIQFPVLPQDKVLLSIITDFCFSSLYHKRPQLMQYLRNKTVALLAEYIGMLIAFRIHDSSEDDEVDEMPAALDYDASPA